MEEQCNSQPNKVQHRHWGRPPWMGKSCGHAGCPPGFLCRPPGGLYSAGSAGSPVPCSLAYRPSRSKVPSSLSLPGLRWRRCQLWRDQRCRLLQRTRRWLKGTGIGWMDCSLLCSLQCDVTITFLNVSLSSVFKVYIVSIHIILSIWYCYIMYNLTTECKLLLTII